MKKRPAQHEKRPNSIWKRDLLKVQKRPTVVWKGTHFRVAHDIIIHICHIIIDRVWTRGLRRWKSSETSSSLIWKRDLLSMEKRPNSIWKRDLLNMEKRQETCGVERVRRPRHLDRAHHIIIHICHIIIDRVWTRDLRRWKSSETSSSLQSIGSLIRVRIRAALCLEILKSQFPNAYTYKGTIQGTFENVCDTVQWIAHSRCTLPRQSDSKRTHSTVREHILQ
jgi:hypothetical protein